LGLVLCLTKSTKSLMWVHGSLCTYARTHTHSFCLFLSLTHTHIHTGAQDSRWPQEICRIQKQKSRVTANTAYCIGVSCDLNLHSQSRSSLFSGTWQKRYRELHNRLRCKIEEMTFQMQYAVHTGGQNSRLSTRDM